MVIRRVNNIVTPFVSQDWKLYTVSNFNLRRILLNFVFFNFIKVTWLFSSTKSILPLYDGCWDFLKNFFLLFFFNKWVFGSFKLRVANIIVLHCSTQLFLRPFLHFFLLYINLLQVCLLLSQLHMMFSHLPPANDLLTWALRLITIFEVHLYESLEQHLLLWLLVVGLRSHQQVAHPVAE